METNQAAENLQVIRTLMERSAVYRRALAPIMIYCGVVGIGGGVAGRLLPIESPSGFVLFWGGVAGAALTGSFILVRRQALKDSEPFWSPPTRRVAQALTPPLLIGAVLGVLLANWGNDTHPQSVLILAWCWLFGCALHSAGFFMPRGIRYFGWLFVVVGCALAACLFAEIDLLRFGNSSHLLMGGIFGGLHLSCGIYLYFTEQRKNVA